MEALKKWMGEDGGVIGIVGGSEMILKSVGILKQKTREEGKNGGEMREEEEEEEEGVSVEEKNGILGIVLEGVEGGGWRGGYEELEEVVGRLEEEGEREWRERKEKREGKNGGREWKEMGRLTREVRYEREQRRS